MIAVLSVAVKGNRMQRSKRPMKTGVSRSNDPEKPRNQYEAANLHRSGRESSGDSPFGVNLRQSGPPMPDDPLVLRCTLMSFCCDDHRNYRRMKLSSCEHQRQQSRVRIRSDPTAQLKALNLAAADLRHGFAAQHQ